jgi:hypothetical protein
VEDDRAVNEKGVFVVLLGDGPTSCAVPPAPITKKYVNEQISLEKNVEKKLKKM